MERENYLKTFKRLLKETNIDIPSDSDLLLAYNTMILNYFELDKIVDENNEIDLLDPYKMSIFSNIINSVKELFPQFNHCEDIQAINFIIAVYVRNRVHMIIQPECLCLN